MKITYFRLKGYVKVLNGMGLDEIIIPFNTFKNRIILIQGENGCSKSTIVDALTPNPDSSDSFRTDVLIDDFGQRQIIEYPAEKEIHYMDIDESGFQNQYVILIKSIVDNSRTKRTTKAFIYKNGEDLNPNGNVTSFKEIRDSLLGIDPIYLDLSSIGNEHRGIVDMIPSERRKYMSSYIGSLETYNNIFKILSKKVNGLKSYINTINSKIYELGNEEELRLRLSQFTQQLESLNSNRDKLLKTLAEAESVVNIVDPDNKMQNLYISISDRLESINSQLSNNQTSLVSLLRKYKEDGDLDYFKSLSAQLESDLSDYNSKINEYSIRISTLIPINESLMRKIEEDSNTLIGLDSNNIPDDIESEVKSLQVEKERYLSYLTENDIRFIKNTSYEELSDLRDALELFLKEINVAEGLHSENEYLYSIDVSFNKSIEKDLLNERKKLQSNITKYNIDITTLKVQLESVKSDIEELSKFDSTRPKECKIDTCPYISRFISMKNSGVSNNNIESIEGSIRNLENCIIEAEARTLFIDNVLETSSYINTAISIIFAKKSIIRKVKPISYLVDDIEGVKNRLKELYRFSDFTIVDNLIEKYSIYVDLQKIETQIQELSGDLKVYVANKTLIDSLKKSVSSNREEYESNSNTIKQLDSDIRKYTDIISNIQEKLNNVKEIIRLYEEKHQLGKDKENLREEFSRVKDTIKMVKEKLDSVNSIKDDILRTEESIKPVSDEITRLQFALTNIVSYQNEYKDNLDQYNKIMFIRNCCSPGSGTAIQGEYIKRYMNDIIIDCNTMLSFMFNGMLQLDIPVITQNDFLMPFIGPNGLVVPDIGSGSTAQRCMIGLVFSCVSLMKASSRYRILRLDELDSGLDQQNRISFIEVLNRILDFMRAEQCIIVSHNTEFDSHSTTKLLCSHTGIKIEQ